MKMFDVKGVLVFLGKNTVPTIVISIISLVVFSTSVYGFVKAANLNVPIEEVPEVKTIEQKLAESIAPVPASGSEDIQQRVPVPSEMLSGSVIPLTPEVSPAPSMTPSAGIQQGGQQNNSGNTASPTPTSVPEQNSQIQDQQPTPVAQNPQPEIDNDIEDVDEDRDSDSDRDNDRERDGDGEDDDDDDDDDD